MGLYNYDKILTSFPQILQQNCGRAALKKQQYLDKIISIFKQFVGKCEKELDHIIGIKIDKLSNNYDKVQQYLSANNQITEEEKNLIIAEFLIKPFEKFPFAGNKNQKLFKEQYNLIEKASVLIQQTLVESFNQDQVPTFENHKFFNVIQSQGIGMQSLTKLRLNPQNFSVSHLHDIIPIQSSIQSIKLLNNENLICIGAQNNVEIWDIMDNFCRNKFTITIPSQISTAMIFKQDNFGYLVIGFSDSDPSIVSYRLDSLTPISLNVNHTRQVTKLLQFNNLLVSGSFDGTLCIHSFNPIKTILSAPHISGIEDIISKNCHLYILQKSSNVLEYELLGDNHQTPISLNFRRSISAGYISMIRFPELTTNFSGVGCHIYGLSQIEITRKFKIQQTNIINVAEMISDFIVLQSKQTSQFFALCIFQNSATIRIYSLTSQQQVYEMSSDYGGQVGTAGYLPKIQVTSINGKYILTIVNQSEFEDEKNTIRVYELNL